MDAALRRRAVEAVVAAVTAETEALTAADAALGDGDHGTNLARGLAAIAAETDAIAAKPLGPALQRAGMLMMTKVGGASGAVYGTLLTAMGKEAGEAERLDAATLARMVAAGTAAVAARGKSAPGEKTLLDVLIPVGEALAAGARDGTDAAALAAAVVATAERGLEATRGMLATKGRAAFLGERSIGHPDPGAMSCTIMIRALAGLR